MDPSLTDGSPEQGVDQGGVEDPESPGAGNIGDPVPGSSNNNTEGGGVSGPPDCGSRTVRSIPDPGQYDWIIESEQQIEGSGGLADYFTLSDADCVGEDIEIPPEMLTVGANGVIEEGTSAGAAFIVSDGCLIEDSSSGIEDSPSGEPDDPHEPCGKDAFPIGIVVPDGLFPGDMGDSQSPFGSDFVCVTIDSTNVCLDCGQKNSEWVTDGMIIILFTAQGSISLPFFDPCTNEMTTIEILEGETAKLTITSRSTVRLSE